MANNVILAVLLAAAQLNVLQVESAYLRAGNATFQFCPPASFEFSTHPIYAKVDLPGGMKSSSTVELENGSAGRQVDDSCASLEWMPLSFTCEPNTMEWNMTSGYFDNGVPPFCDAWEPGHGYITNPNEEYMEVLDTSGLAGCPPMEVVESIGPLSVKFDLPSTLSRGDGLIEFIDGKIVRSDCLELAWTDHAFRCDAFSGEWKRLYGSFSKKENREDPLVCSNVVKNGNNQPYLEVMDSDVTQAPSLQPANNITQATSMQPEITTTQIPSMQSHNNMTQAPSMQPQVQLPTLAPVGLTAVPVPASTPPTIPLPTRLPSGAPTEESTGEALLPATELNTSSPVSMPPAVLALMNTASPSSMPPVVTAPLNTSSTASMPPVLTATPTASPTVQQTVETSAPSQKPIPSSSEPATIELAGGTFCGCSSCDSTAMGAPAASFTCGDRINYLFSSGTTMTNACRQISGIEHPDTCSPCNPDTCVPTELPANTTWAPTIIDPPVNSSVAITPAPMASTSVVNATIAPTTPTNSTDGVDTEPNSGNSSTPTLVTESDVGATASNVISSGREGMLLSSTVYLQTALLLIGFMAM